MEVGICIIGSSNSFEIIPGYSHCAFPGLSTDAVEREVVCLEPVVGFRFFVREEPHDSAAEWDTGLYSVRHDGLVDTRFSGRSCRMRLEAMHDGDFVNGRVRLQMKQAGLR